jgi:hypothetical protein
LEEEFLVVGYGDALLLEADCEPAEEVEAGFFVDGDGLDWES